MKHDMFVIEEKPGGKRISTTELEELTQLQKESR